ncbi:hypothetical protein C5O80_30465 [Burkholderia sp. SRS-46]|nr:hypothetical protein C5O80_30465 [Burkholderia sp. SRS-46]
MTPEQITSLGEALAKAARRANEASDKAGADQNRGQFVKMVSDALGSIPADLRGEAAIDFLGHNALHPYGQQ